MRTRNDTANLGVRLGRLMERWSWLLRARLPRGAGTTAFALLIAATVGYGVVKGEHLPDLIEALKSARDGLGNQAGFRIKSIAISGITHMSREEVLAVGGITGSTSLLFLDVEETRERLKSSAWVADASVLKLYPGELQINIRERAAFALWQKDGNLAVIAQDGTVLDAFIAPVMMRLPLVVGQGAQTEAKAFLELLDRHPALLERVRASVLVGERRWNLRLKNGLDVQLPETGVAAALDRLVALDRQKNLIDRDIVIIDLRLADRVTVRLSDAAAEARATALKEKKTTKKGRDS
ncbi:MAG: cell division protein FtsQ/DivIB [Pseudolabrys sp.]